MRIFVEDAHSVGSKTVTQETSASLASRIVSPRASDVRGWIFSSLASSPLIASISDL